MEKTMNAIYVNGKLYCLWICFKELPKKWTSEPS